MNEYHKDDRVLYVSIINDKKGEKGGKKKERKNVSQSKYDARV